MKTYIQPYTYCTRLVEESHILAGSDPIVPSTPNAATDEGSVNIPGYSQAGGTDTDINGNVSDMAKPYNPWTSWDDFDL